MLESKKRTFNPKVETKLTRQDFKRVDDLATVEGKTKSEVVREAVLFYLAHKDEKRNEPRDKVIAEAIDGMANRLCAMLARQGRQVGTIHELLYLEMSATKEGKASFDAAAATANQKHARSVTREERPVIEEMKKRLKE